MSRDAFSNRHPAVNFAFFLAVICCAVVIQHPAYLALGIFSGAAYYLLLHGRKGLRGIAGMLPIFLILSLLNPLFNTYGAHILFHIFGRPYTLEALLYGFAIGGVFLEMLLWFGCYNAVLTSDKFTALFGNLIPALSLLLVMVLRLIPSFLRKAAQLAGARKSIGKGAAEGDTAKEKLTDGMAILGALTSWALEGSIVTADSMRSRGYGTARRSSFQIYRMTGEDLRLLTWMGLLLAALILLGNTHADFTPVLEIAPVRGRNTLGLVAYGAFALLPAALHTKEAIAWHISRSGI